MVVSVLVITTVIFTTPLWRPLRQRLRLYGFRLYHEVEHVEGGRCAACGCRALELLDPQYIAYAFAMGEALDIDVPRFPFGGSSDHQALVVIVPLAVLQAGVGRRRISGRQPIGLRAISRKTVVPAP